ncbi:hypothetical protein DM02DRAFT_143911 [Periconia macrospinosa]|uniref:Uncharacterized protein n=1 Tax=Periconia macrospinosa TaxID=97972 RepID=A0A2V1E2N2_9PLEO|nr:hypothetical protein DM02DRAFT_143911 [Periconia macrospinosa]
MEFSCLFLFRIYVSLCSQAGRQAAGIRGEGGGGGIECRCRCRTHTMCDQYMYVCMFYVATFFFLSLIVLLQERKSEAKRKIRIYRIYMYLLHVLYLCISRYLGSLVLFVAYIVTCTYICTYTLECSCRRPGNQHSKI